MLNIYINAAATSPENAIVVSDTNQVNAKLPAIVFGDTFAARLYITDGASGFDSVSGAAGYVVKAAIGTRGAVPTGGTFTLTYGGQTTSALSYAATAAQIQAALRALSSINGAYVTVTGSSPAWEVEFIGTLAETNVAQITADGTSLTPSSAVSISTIQAGTTGYNEKQLIYVAQNPGWLSSQWTRITNGWSGEVSTARQGISAQFTTRSAAITLYFEVEITDSSGKARTYCSAPITILPEVIDFNSLGQNSFATLGGGTLPLVVGTGVAISGQVVTVSGRGWPVAPSSVFVTINIPSADVTVIYANPIGTPTTDGFVFIINTLPDNSSYTFTYVPII